MFFGFFHVKRSVKAKAQIEERGSFAGPGGAYCVPRLKVGLCTNSLKVKLVPSPSSKALARKK